MFMGEEEKNGYNNGVSYQHIQCEIVMPYQ